MREIPRGLREKLKHKIPTIENGHWSTEKAAWTGISAVSSIVSLGWGIAAYSSAMRMTREDKGKMTWAGMITQALWRAGMLTARIVALVMLSLAVNEWAFLVLCKFFLINEFIRCFHKFCFTNFSQFEKENEFLIFSVFFSSQFAG